MALGGTWGLGPRTGESVRGGMGRAELGPHFVCAWVGMLPVSG